MSDFELRISKATKNALTGTDPNDFIFHSKYNTFKIIAHGTTTISVPDTGAFSVGQMQLAHGMSYIPFVIAYVKLPISGRVAYNEAPEPSSFSVGTVGYAIDDTYVNLYVINHLSSTTRNFVVSYYICEVPL